MTIAGNECCFGLQDKMDGFVAVHFFGWWLKVGIQLFSFLFIHFECLIVSFNTNFSEITVRISCLYCHSYHQVRLSVSMLTAISCLLF